MRKFFRKAVGSAAMLVAAIGLATAQTANLQVIHNCADPLADTVDVYVNGTLTLNDLAFRTATGFLPVPSGVALNVGIAAGNSTSVNDTLISFLLGPLTSGENYVVMASGVVGSGFAANPDGKNTAFDLKVITPAETAASNSNKVDFAIFHGVTDAPGVDVKVTDGPTLATNAQYGDATAYIAVDPGWYPIDVYATGGTTPVARYLADLSSLTGGAAVVFASGFLTPALNNNGPAFGLYAALPNGTVVPLPAQEFAQVQVIHNCADPAAASVDVYIDGTKALDDFAFRTATPFIDLLAGVDHSIAIAPANSISVNDAIATFSNINLTANEKYAVVASGVVGSGFAANPDAVATSFHLDIITGAQTVASDTNKVELLVYHGVTDAPTVDVKVSGGPTIVNDAAYTDYTPYLAVNPASYLLEVQDETGTTTLATYVADLTMLKGGSGIVLASGFLNPAVNNNGPGFGLFLALPSGGNLIALPAYTSVADVTDEVQVATYPNPANTTLYVNLTGAASGRTTVDLTDLSGRVIQHLYAGAAPAETLVADRLNQLANGLYLLRITSGASVTTQRIAIRH